MKVLGCCGLDPHADGMGFANHLMVGVRIAADDESFAIGLKGVEQLRRRSIGRRPKGLAGDLLTAESEYMVARVATTMRGASRAANLSRHPPRRLARLGRRAAAPATRGCPGPCHASGATLFDAKWPGAARPEYPGLRRLISARSPAVSAVSVVEVLGYHRLTTAERVHFESFFAAAEVLPLSDAVVASAVTLRQTRKMSLGVALVAATALVFERELPVSAGRFIAPPPC